MDNQFQIKLMTLRKEKGMSQEFLADKLFVSRQTVSKWENGETTPDLDNLINLASLFNITLDELVFNKKSITEKQQQPIFYNNSKNTNTNLGDLFNRFWWLIFPIGGGIMVLAKVIFNR